MTGTFLGRIPFARVGPQRDPIVVVAGGQAFVRRPTPEATARDAGRIARLLPRDRGFILVGYDPTPADYSLSAIGRDLAAILAGLGPSTVIGISYGGVSAVRAAVERPDLVTRLVLLASAHDFSPEGKERVRRQIDCASRGDLAALVGDFVAVFRRPYLNWLVRMRLAISRARVTGALNDPELIVRGLRAVLDDPTDPVKLARVTAPCLLLAGARDQFFGGMQERTAALLPHATLDVVAKETHMLPVERPDRVARALAAFLA